MRRLIPLVLLLAACQPQATEPKIKGDEVMPGEVEVTGLAYCDAARLELAAIVLNGAPKGAALEDVGDAKAPGCTWIAAAGDSRVRLNVYDEAMRQRTGAGAVPAQFDALAAAHSRTSQGTELYDIGVRAARFGFTEAAPNNGVILVETADAVLEFEGAAVSPAKLAIFARGVSERIDQATG
jgi:hypothetical protein